MPCPKEEHISESSIKAQGEREIPIVDVGPMRPNVVTIGLTLVGESLATHRSWNLPNPT